MNLLRKFFRLRDKPKITLATSPFYMSETLTEAF